MNLGLKIGNTVVLSLIDFSLLTRLLVPVGSMFFFEELELLFNPVINHADLIENPKITCKYRVRASGQSSYVLRSL